MSKHAGPFTRLRWKTLSFILLKGDRCGESHLAVFHSEGSSACVCALVLGATCGGVAGRGRRSVGMSWRRVLLFYSHSDIQFKLGSASDDDPQFLISCSVCNDRKGMHLLRLYGSPERLSSHASVCPPWVENALCGHQSGNHGQAYQDFAIR